jgi:hypothetical protein
VEDAPKVLGHAFMSKWAVGARSSGGHHGLGVGVPAKWREQKTTSTYILRLRRNSKGVCNDVTEANYHHHFPWRAMRFDGSGSAAGGASAPGNGGGTFVARVHTGEHHCHPLCAL